MAKRPREQLRSRLRSAKTWKANCSLGRFAIAHEYVLQRGLAYLHGSGHRHKIKIPPLSGYDHGRGLGRFEQVRPFRIAPLHGNGNIDSPDCRQSEIHDLTAYADRELSADAIT